MKNIGSATLSCVIIMLLALFSQAQSLPTLIAPTETVESNSIYIAHIKVTNFERIVGAQFTVSWDSAVLRFQETRDFRFRETSLAEAFGMGQVTSGQLSFAWLDGNLVPRSLSDSSTLFAIVFEVIGKMNDQSPIRFTDDGPSREIADANGNATPGEYHNGMVTVTETTTNTHIYNTAPHKIQVQNSYPNPFRDQTRIVFQLKEPVQARVVITNLKGQAVYETQRLFSSGANTLLLTNDMFPEAGIYQYAIIAPDFTVTQKLIFQ